MARSGGTYVHNPETGKEDLVKDSQTRMPSIAERRAQRTAAETAIGDDRPAQPERKAPRTPRRDRDAVEATESKE